MNPSDLLYTKEHEWIRIEGGDGTVGITDYAQAELGDVVYVELPRVGETYAAGQEFGVVESVKSVSPLFMPVSGEIVEINSKLEDAPELVNTDAYGEGWMVKIRVSGPAEAKSLLAADEYGTLTARPEES